MAEIPGYLTITEAAAIIGVCHSQAARYIREERLKAVDLGGQKLIKRQDAEKFKRPARGNPNFVKPRKRRTA